MSDVATLLILMEHRMQTRQARGMGGEKGVRKETSRLGFTSRCPSMSGGQRGGRTLQGPRAGPRSAIVRKQKSCSCPGCHVSEGAWRAVSMLAGSFPGILAPSIHHLGWRDRWRPPQQDWGFCVSEALFSAPSSSPPSIPGPLRHSVKPKRPVPPGTWHRACVFRFIPSPLATLCVFGVYIPGCLDTVPSRPHSWCFLALPVIG